MQVTKVTQDPKTGQLHFKREEIRTNVFRPHWNQPTMTLNELGDIEVADAMERAQKQKEEEAAALNRPRRYDQLERDGMEDCADLADASSKLDRDWDDFKDDNPRGIGNKLSERGDKNF
uniref:Uncharacterized protein n=1 Tax=Proboscia inermis TaxID=420281 RepID=A0A7S0GIF8_9STRA